jgi:hypothetical protein
VKKLDVVLYYNYGKSAVEIWAPSSIEASNQPKGSLKSIGILFSFFIEEKRGEEEGGVKGSFED